MKYIESELSPIHTVYTGRGYKPIALYSVSILCSEDDMRRYNLLCTLSFDPVYGRPMWAMLSSAIIIYPYIQNLNDPYPQFLCTEYYGEHPLLCSV